MDLADSLYRNTKIGSLQPFGMVEGELLVGDFDPFFNPVVVTECASHETRFADQFGAFRREPWL